MRNKATESENRAKLYKHRNARTTQIHTHTLIHSDAEEEPRSARVGLTDRLIDTLSDIHLKASLSVVLVRKT